MNEPIRIQVPDLVAQHQKEKGKRPIDTLRDLLVLAVEEGRKDPTPEQVTGMVDDILSQMATIFDYLVNAYFDERLVTLLEGIGVPGNGKVPDAQ